MSDQEKEYPLINPAIDKAKYGEKYHEHILEQYKLYVDTSTQVTNWRNNANAFFITLNSLIITLIAVFGGESKGTQVLFLVIAVVGLIAANVVWLTLIQKYKALNDAKFDVVEDLEQLLPVMPFVSREWKHYHAKLNSESKHNLLTHSERWVPILLIVIYSIGLMIFVSYRLFTGLLGLLGVL
jgi:hypothetical protein